MFEIRRVTQSDTEEGFLDKFDRAQEVSRVWKRMDGEYRLVDSPLTMDWSAEKKRSVAKSMLEEGMLSYAAFDGDTAAGILLLESKLRGERLVLDMISVNRAYRRHGLGKRLFQLAVSKAKEMGARQLYLSAFSGEETIAFYRAMGCEVTSDPIAEIERDEPADLQMTLDIVR